jgi:hypothetical protein
MFGLLEFISFPQMLWNDAGLQGVLVEASSAVKAGSPHGFAHQLAMADTDERRERR